MATPWDVSNLNRSVADLGDTFRTRRLDEEQRREKMAEELLRQQMAGTEAKYRQDQTDIERQRLGLEKEKGTREEKADKQRFLQTLMSVNAAGQISDFDAVNKWLDTDPDFSKIGLQLKAPPEKPTPQLRHAAVVDALQKADEYRTAGKTEYADMLEKWVQRAGTSPEDYVETTTRTEPPEAPAPEDLKKPRVTTTTRTRKPVTPTGKPAGPAGKTRMISPNGTPGLVPNEQVEKAKSMGYKLAP